MANVTRQIWKNGTAIKGRIELKHKGKWGSIYTNTGYSSYFDKTAHVFCKSMGIKFNRAWIIPYFGGGKGPTWLKYVYCSGKNDNSLTSCSSSSLTDYKKSHSYDLGVACHMTNQTSDPNYRMYNKKKYGNGYYGGVQVYYNGRWGTVCDDGFGTNEAKVFCRSMGMPYAKA